MGGVWEHLRRCGAVCGVWHREHLGERGGAESICFLGDAARLEWSEGCFAVGMRLVCRVSAGWESAGCGCSWGAFGLGRGVQPLLGCSCLCSRARRGVCFGVQRGTCLLLDADCFWGVLRGAVPCEMGDRRLQSLQCWEMLLCFRGVRHRCPPMNRAPLPHRFPSSCLGCDQTLLLQLGCVRLGAVLQPLLKWSRRAPRAVPRSRAECRRPGELTPFGHRLARVQEC